MADPTAAYRKQQGLGAITGGPDSKLIGWVKQAAQQTGADPAALLATSLQESGGRLNGPAGDAGTSYGPFQFHVGGALGSHPPAWASTYAAVLNRAQEFAEGQVHGGVGAAAIQRPLDRTLYAQGVASRLGEARRLLGSAAPAPMVGTRPQSTPGIRTNDTADLGAHVNASLQALIDSSARNAGIASIQLPAMPQAATPAAPQAPAPNAINPTAPLGSGNRGIYNHGNWAGADQGVDYRGTGHVTALADAVVTRVQAKSSWIGAGGKGTGAIVSYRITSGPYKGRNVYVAENITPHVKVGQRVRAGQPIATAHGSFPYTESGWADAGGSPTGALGTSNTGRDFAKSWNLA